MTKEQKIEAIYEAMADKTLSDGCVILAGGNKSTLGNAKYYMGCGFMSEHIAVGGCWCRAQEYNKGEYQIIGHPVRIGNVLEYADFPTKFHSFDAYGGFDYTYGIESELFFHWQNKRLPIDDQSEATISYVFDLIKEVSDGNSFI